MTYFIAGCWAFPQFSARRPLRGRSGHSSVRVSPPRGSATLACPWGTSRHTVPTRHRLAGYFTSLELLKALGRAALRVDPAKSSDFEGVWLPRTSSRLVASRQPRVDSAHSFVRQTPFGRRTRVVGKQPSITRQPLSGPINQAPCSAHPCRWTRGTRYGASATPAPAALHVVKAAARLPWYVRARGAADASGAGKEIGPAAARRLAPRRV